MAKQYLDNGLFNLTKVATEKSGKSQIISARTIVLGGTCKCQNNKATGCNIAGGAELKYPALLAS